MHNTFRTFLILFSLFVLTNQYSPYFKYRGYRSDKECKKVVGGSGQPFYRKSVFESPLYLLLLIFLSIFLFLLFMGLVKAIVGLNVSKTVGEFGMGLLVDLPKPLEQYREPDISSYPVEYDVGGWPIHPISKQRTVRVLPMRTEFCLNMVFFLAYPLALVFQLCALCCCIKYKTKDEEKSCFKSVNVIKYNEKVKFNTVKPGQKVDRYNDADDKEARDTRYVVQQMQMSQSSLQNNS